MTLTDRLTNPQIIALSNSTRYSVNRSRSCKGPFIIDVTQFWLEIDPYPPLCHTKMLTLESRRFPMLGEVSFCTRTLPNRFRNGARSYYYVGADSLIQVWLITFMFSYLQVCNYCNGTIAYIYRKLLSYKESLIWSEHGQLYENEQKERQTL